MCQFVEISNQMESNGEVSNLEQNFLYNTILYKNILYKVQNVQIGTLRAKDLRKNVSILQEGGLTPVPYTLLVIRVVFLHTL